jgi:capsular exopolysaccharide synthesis family protein
MTEPNQTVLSPIPNGNGGKAPQYYAPPLPAQYQVAAPEGDGDSQHVPLVHYLWILKRHFWKMAIFIVICVTSTFVVSSRLTPIYEATSTVDVDRQAPSSIIGQDSNRAAVNDSDQFLATQIKLIQSDAVLRPVAQKYDLLHREKAISTNAEKAARAARAPVLLSRLKVTRPPNTYLLLISYRSPDAQLAADVANSTAQSYLQHTYNIRIRSSLSLSTFMEQQMEELRAKMERSGQALVKFERELGLINPEEKTNILQARLLQLNTEYTNAQSDRVRKESIWNSVKSGSLEAVQVSGQADQLVTLTQHLNEARQHFAEVTTTYGSTHPEYRKASSQVAELTRQFADTRKNIEQRVEADFNQSLGREKMLQRAVLETKSEADRINASSFEYQQLKRDAEADKKLYDELVQKIKEAGINAGFQNNNIRIADTARPGEKPVFPNITMNLMFALFFSTVLAIGASILSDVMDTTIRDPEETSRYLGIDVLGILPAVKNPVQLNAIATPALHAATLAKSALETSNPKNGGLLYKSGKSYHKDGYYRSISGFEEAIRTLRNTILLQGLDCQIRSLLITSASPGEGKTTAASHLAVANSEQGKRTLLVDGDLRRPNVHRKFGITPKTGLSTVLTEGASWKDHIVRLEGRPNLSILPAGSPSHRASDLVGRNIADLLDEFSKEYDLVILDAPPVLGFSESLQMAIAVDGVVVVGYAGETKRKAIGSVLSALNRIRANVIGLVLNQVKKDTSDQYSYSYYGYLHSYYGYNYARRPETNAS